MKPVGDASVSMGVREQRFDVECGGRTVPGLLWTPEAPGEGRPLALLGHGGSLHKRADYILGVARRLVRHHGIASLAIDGPGHGDRRRDGGHDPEQVGRDFEGSWNGDAVTDAIVADWRASLDAVAEAIRPSRIGYFGLSMGTMMGVPLMAAEPRIEAAVLGLMGVWGPNGDRLRDDAARISCPVRFLVQWNDEVVPRDTCLELFDRIGSARKALRAHPGKHVEVPPTEMREVADYLAAELG